MKSKNRFWAFLSISLMILVATMALGGYTPGKFPLDETTTTANLIADSPVQNGHIPSALTKWELKVVVDDPRDEEPGYVIATIDGKGTRSIFGALWETYAEGAIVKLEARANVGWEFDHWYGQILNMPGGEVPGNYPSNDNPIYVRMYQDVGIDALFTQLDRVVVNSTEGGSVSKEGSYYYRRGDEVTLTAEPEPGFFFVGWNGDTENVQYSGNQIEFKSDRLFREIEAVFIELPQVVDVPIVIFPWTPLPLGPIQPPLDTDPVPGPIIEGEIEEDLLFPPGSAVGPQIDLVPPGELFDEDAFGDIEGTIRPPLPWEQPSETGPGSDVGKDRQTGKGEKPSGKLLDSGIRKLEVVVTPGSGGAVEVFNDSLGSLYVTGAPDIDMTEVPVKPSSKPEGTWAGAMTFNWIIKSDNRIRLVAKPFEGYRFVGWNIDKYTPRKKPPDTGLPGTESSEERWVALEMMAGPHILNPENPELKIWRLHGDLRIYARFAPIESEGTAPEDALPEEDLDVEDEDTEDDSRPIPIEVNVSTTSDTIDDEAGCGSIVTINYEAIDTSTRSHPIAYVQLDIDGEEYSSWSGVPSPIAHYKKEASLDSGCLEVHVIQLKAINKDGQTKTTTKEAKIPPLSTHFEWGVLDALGEGDCQMQLIINYQAVDSGTPENPVTNVVVKANGATWQNSGNISSLWYEKSFVKLVDCGQLYRIEVIGTDADGNKYTYRKTITIPEAEPEEPPPPPPPPTPQTTLYAAYAASAQCSGSGLECGCQLTISFDGKDLTVGDYPVKRVILKVNGTNWRDSGDITKTHHHDSVTKTVDCGQTFNIELIVRNSIGQEVKSTGSITTPGP